jgi:hypothetical protein
MTKSADMSVSADIHVNGTGRPSRDDILRPRVVDPDNPAISSAMSEKRSLTRVPGKENVRTAKIRYVPSPVRRYMQLTVPVGAFPLDAMHQAILRIDMESFCGR